MNRTMKAIGYVACWAIALLLCVGTLLLASPPRSGKWPKVREEHLRKHPVCEVCGHDKGLNVHHIIPYHIKPELELDPDNLITLGEECPTGNHHLLFGHLGNWKSWNKDVRKDAAEWRKKIESRP